MSYGKGTPTRVASAPEHAKSPHYEIKRALHRINVAADDMKRSPIGLASARFGSDDDLIFRGVAADWVARILPRDRLDLMRAAAETIRLRLRAGLLGAR